MTQSVTLGLDTAADYLVSRGFAAAATDLEVRSLDGGVSNDVLGVRGPGVDVVMKQALAQLRVADEWLAKQERLLTEGAALRLAATITPDHVPEVLDLDPDAGILTIECAPDGWTSWKQRLLAGVANPTVARTLGEVLARWHVTTADDTEIAATFDDADAFVQLRVDPYHRTVAARAPDLAGAVNELADRMLATNRCLVHGDFSPKNVLVGPGDEDDRTAVWVLDFEVAHTGDPAFDLGFLHNHLLLKAIHRPDHAPAYRACAHAFRLAYEAGVPDGFAGDEAHLLAHLGCLLAARAIGKSPAEYLDQSGRDRALDLGRRILFHELTTLDAVWETL